MFRNPSKNLVTVLIPTLLLVRLYYLWGRVSSNTRLDTTLPWLGTPRLWTESPQSWVIGPLVELGSESWEHLIDSQTVKSFIVHKTNKEKTKGGLVPENFVELIFDTVKKDNKSNLRFWWPINHSPNTLVERKRTPPSDWRYHIPCPTVWNRNPV